MNHLNNLGKLRRKSTMDQPHQMSSPDWLRTLEVLLMREGNIEAALQLVSEVARSTRSTLYQGLIAAHRYHEAWSYGNLPARKLAGHSIIVPRVCLEENWLIDILPRIVGALQQSSGTVKHLIVCAPLTEFMLETLAPLGISPPMVVSLEDQPRIEPESLDCITEVVSGWHGRAAAYRELTLGYRELFPKKPTKRIVLAPRVLSGWELLLEELRAEYGFVIINPSELPLAQLIEILSEGEFIIDARSEGNLLFASAHAYVVEVGGATAELAKSSNLDYRPVQPGEVRAAVVKRLGKSESVALQYHVEFIERQTASLRSAREQYTWKPGQWSISFNTNYQINAVNGVFGELSSAEIEYLYNLGAQLPPGGRYLEIGSFLGLSAISFASGVNQQNNLDAQIVCVDTWSGTNDNQQIIEIKEGALYAHFLDNIEQAGVQHLITPFRMSAEKASSLFCDNYFDIIFFNQAHASDSYLAHLVYWSSKCKDNGTILVYGDEALLPFQRTIERFAMEQQLAATIQAGPSQRLHVIRFSSALSSARDKT